MGILVAVSIVSKNKAKAKAQRQVIIYAAQDQVYAEPILREFEQETGIKVKTVFDSEAVKTVGLANRLLAERSAGLDRGAQHIAGGNLRDTEMLADELRLRALA